MTKEQANGGRGGTEEKRETVGTVSIIVEKGREVNHARLRVRGYETHKKE